MKSYSEYTPPETVGLNFQRLGVPSGKNFPRAPISGELFLLEVDFPDGSKPWYAAGLYVNAGLKWNRIDNPRARACSPIGAQKYEIEEKIDVSQPPIFGAGLQISNASIVPSNRRGSISGTAIFTVEHEKDCHMLTTVFREKKPVGFVVSKLEAFKTQHIALSFLDNPGVRTSVAYTLEICVDATGFMNVNQTASHCYDGTSQTAFIVEENTR